MDKKRTLRVSGLEQEEPRDIEHNLRKWRVTERKIELKEKLYALSIRELLPKTQQKAKLQLLEDLTP